MIRTKEVNIKTDEVLLKEVQTRTSLASNVYITATGDTTFSLHMPSPVISFNRVGQLLLYKSESLKVRKGLVILLNTRVTEVSRPLPSYINIKAEAEIKDIGPVTIDIIHVAPVG